MKKTIMLTACLLIGGNRAGSNFKKDARAMMVILQSSMNYMEELSNCYNTNNKINDVSDKDHCLAILANFAKLGRKRSKSSRRRSSPRRGTQSDSQPARTSRPKLRRQCRRFHLWSC